VTTFRDLTVDDVDEAGAVLGRAFADAPGYRAILAHLPDARRARGVTRAKRAFANAAVHHQRAEGAFVDGRLAGVALISEPGDWPAGLGVFARQAVGCVPLGVRAIRNFLRADGYMTKRHPEEPHHYLFVLGVEPARQGQGLGKALLARLAARADEDGLPCYLETDKESNVRLYQRAGYEVIDEGDVPTRPTFHLWTMIRPPR
jgi:ribosomal protein S18 acetylase RimI-like enzyme